LCSFLAQSQQILKGRLIAEDTRLPVNAASIYLSNTSAGTISKNDGSFQIHPFPNGRYDLVVSVLGFETYVIAVQSNKLPDFLEIVLKPKVND
ncbi:carboxypeptidase-like regulatory domain-containing protein, partial [Klebsiella pneumoniae]|uniref:carboxypeptidase-like regulatory domain-containing protein n=2 Tax=Enterobacterales TaxID=91347 RepID=UPI0038539CD1